MSDPRDTGAAWPEIVIQDTIGLTNFSSPSITLEDGHIDAPARITPVEFAQTTLVATSDVRLLLASNEDRSCCGNCLLP